MYIEQCVCPPGYTGLSCESCSPGYERSSSGTCRRPSETCPTGYYADPDTGRIDKSSLLKLFLNFLSLNFFELSQDFDNVFCLGECNVCPCPLTTPSNQFGRECRVDTDRQVDG